MTQFLEHVTHHPRLQGGAQLQELIGPALLKEQIMRLQLKLTMYILAVINHASRTLPHLPYTNLKKSRTEKKLVTEHAQKRQLAREIVQCSKCWEVNTEKSVYRAVVFLEVEEGGQDRYGRSSQSLFNQIHS